MCMGSSPKTDELVDAMRCIRRVVGVRCGPAAVVARSLRVCRRILMHLLATQRIVGRSLEAHDGLRPSRAQGWGLEVERRAGRAKLGITAQRHGGKVSSIVVAARARDVQILDLMTERVQSCVIDASWLVMIEARTIRRSGQRGRVLGPDGRTVRTLTGSCSGRKRLGGEEVGPVVLAHADTRGGAVKLGSTAGGLLRATGRR